MTEHAGLCLPARAKLNLVLRIVGRRTDGYHLLETLFHAIELHDELWVVRAPHGIELQVTADEPAFAVSPGPDNLVVKALARLATEVGTASGFAARLHKRIPHGAGLGGGSSDAAAALRLGNQLLGRPLDDAQLARLAKGLGADVPFFLRGGSQWGRGIGDELTPATVPPQHFVLVVPPYGCATAEVYKNYAALWKGSPPQDTVRGVTGPNTRDSAVSVRFCNDLEQAAETVTPALAGLRRQVEKLGYPGVRMTGSGSTLFLAFADAESAEHCEKALAPLRGSSVRLVKTRSAVRVDAALPRPPGRRGSKDRGGG